MRNLVKIGFVAVLATIMGYGVYTSQKSNNELSDLMLANVEALADGAEYPSSPNADSKCKGGPYMCYMGQGNVWGKN